MSSISVLEASRQLGVGVQRIHQRIADGSLPAQRVGSQWVIDEVSLQWLDSRGPGQPLSVRSVWAIVLLDAARRHDGGADRMVQALAPAVRSRARARLQDLVERSAGVDLGAEEDVADQAAMLRRMCQRRASRQVYRAAPPDVPDLRSDGRLDLAGASRPESGLAVGNLVEGYVADVDHDAVVGDFLLVPASPQVGNVVLHVYDSQKVQREVVRAGGSLLLAADLAEHRSPREELQAARALRDLGAEWSEPLANDGVDLPGGSRRRGPRG